MSGGISQWSKWLAAAAAAAAIISGVVWLELRVAPVESAPGARADLAPETPDLPAAPPVRTPAPSSSPPMKIAELENRARTARTAPPSQVFDRPMTATGPPCAAMHGAWRSPDGAQLTLRAGGTASWKVGPGRSEQLVHWVCMQNGAAQALLPDRILRLSAGAAGELEALDSHDGRLALRRAEP